MKAYTLTYSSPKKEIKAFEKRLCEFIGEKRVVVKRGVYDERFLLQRQNNNTEIYITVPSAEFAANNGLSLTLVSGDRRKRQVILRLREPRAEVERVPSKEIRNPMMSPADQKEDASVQRYLRGRDLVAYPEGTVFHYTGYVLVADVPEHDTYLLVGMDDTHPFICALRHPVETVAQAHEALIPPEVRQARLEGLDVKRQGEFFFVPATEDEVMKQLKRLRKRFIEQPKPNPFGGEPYTEAFALTAFDQEGEAQDTSHLVSLPAVQSDISLVDSIRDSLGRAVPLVTGVISCDTHHPIILTSYHKMYLNLEVENFGNGYD